ncbi:RNA polymerase sigma factor for flagellar operon [hydrothermal vent metagenome]|uniref:RNA polymerase sigma factor for flagellar operon n=1 Tax=hydrothermal vent metagenome TaxID=652676 RepID=A0A3B1E7I6_9ZZZZ
MAVARSSVGRIGSRGASRRSARHAEPSNIPSPYDDIPIKDVWVEYQSTSDGAIRNFLMEKYLHLVRYNAERIYARLPDEVDIEDLMSAGIFGLMDAIDAFDLDRKVKFETYCAPRIRGAILDELRSMDWVPRLVRQRTGKVEQVRQRIEKETGITATEEDIADRLGVDDVELEKYLRDGKAIGTVSLNRRCFPSDGSRDVREIDIIRDDSQTNPLAEIQRNDLKDLITKGLSRAEKLIVLLYYYEGMTMKEIGATLDLSESRVSQMHSSILARLKAQMQHRMKELEETDE